MISSKGVIALGLAIVCGVFLVACGGSSSKPAPAGPPTIITTTIPNAVVGIPYQTSISATGGTGTYTWAITSGSLPPGLNFNASSAIISGTATGPAGNSQFTVQVTDQAQKSSSQVLNLYVEGVAMITTTSPLATGSVGVAYSQQLAATGGVGPYTWCVLSGNTCDATQASLPAGLTLSAGGLISGVPTTNGGPTTFSVQVTDSQPSPSGATAKFSITVLTITTSSLPAATIGQQYTATLTASGGSGKLSWSCPSPCNLPPGLALSSGGVISGTPTALGAYAFTVKVQDSQKNPASVTASFSITVQFVITTTVLPGGTVGIFYNFTLMASGGMPPISWCIVEASGICDNGTGGALPAGLSLDQGTGVISGTPTSAGTSSFTVQATDSSSPPGPFKASAKLNLQVNPAITNANLKGNYVFSFSGYNSGKTVLMAGSFVADGNGNITSGVLDYNDGTGEVPDKNGDPIPQLIGAGSSYSINPNGLGTMTLVTNLSPPSPYSFNVSIRSDGSGKMIQTAPAYGSGAIEKHTPLAQGQQWPLCGSYVAVGLFGSDSSSSRYAAAGEFRYDPTTCVDAESGVMDINDGGSVSSASFSGAFNLYDNTTSRGFTGITFKPGGVHVYAFYLVSSSDHKLNELILLATDPSPAPLTLWSGLPQTSNAQFGAGNWNNLALAGTAVAEINALDNNVTPDVTAGLFVGQGQRTNACPSTDTASFNFDENQGGTSNLKQSSTGTYCIDKLTGRVTLTPFTTGPFAAPPVFYMVGGNKAFVVGTDLAVVTSGYLEGQTGSPFTNGTIIGPYTGGTVTPVTMNVTNGVTWLLSDGSANMSGTENTSGSGGPGTQTLAYTYQIDGTGRIVFTGNPAAVGYVISPTKVVLFPTTDANPALSVLTSSNN